MSDRNLSLKEAERQIAASCSKECQGASVWTRGCQRGTQSHTHAHVHVHAHTHTEEIPQFIGKDLGQEDFGVPGLFGLHG